MYISRVHISSVYISGADDSSNDATASTMVHEIAGSVLGAIVGALALGEHDDNDGDKVV